MPKLKLHTPTVLESAVQRQIVDYRDLREKPRPSGRGGCQLRHEQAHGRIGPFARINGGKARLAGFWVSFYRLWMPSKREATAGYVDLHGLYGPRSAHPGRYFALEVKQVGEAATEAQRALLDAVRVPVLRVPEIEAVFGISRHDLRPDFFGPKPSDAQSPPAPT